MATTHEHHQQLRDLLSAQRWDDAQALWLDLAEQLADEQEFLLLLTQEFSNAGQPELAAELASLLAPALKEAGKPHEYLFALKLQARGPQTDKMLRAQVIEAYKVLHETDPRFRTVLATAGLDDPKISLDAAIARMDTLLAFSADSFCLHKSWGVGRIKSFDAMLSRLIISFPHNPEHAFQLAYAAESLIPISHDHIEAQKATDLDALKQLAQTDPLALLRIVLLSYNRTATVDRIEAALSVSVLPAADWKKWWDNAKKLMKRDPHFELPAKKSDPVVLRSAPVSQQDELLAQFRDAPGLEQKTSIARQLLKIVDDIDNRELILEEFQDGLLDALGKARSVAPAHRIEAALAIEDLQARQKTPPAAGGSTLEGILVHLQNLPATLDQLTGSSQRRVLGLLKRTQPDRLLEIVNDLPTRALDEIADLLPQRADRIFQHVQNQTASPELLGWIAQNFSSARWLQPLEGQGLILAMLDALETAPAKSVRKLRDVLFEEQSLLPDLLANASTDSVRDIARQLMTSPALGELDRRSLMARIVKEFPLVQEFLVTKTVKEQPLIISWASYHKRNAEMEDIIQNKIPQNSKEIAQARSYGDLRENFEYKAAKDMQRLLMRRRAELENLLARAQPTDFADARTDVVSIGTTVTLTDLTTNQQHTYHILGAWDSDTNRNIISYPAALAQALLNKKPGETVETGGEGGKLAYRIDRIEKVPVEILQAL
jgi:transcription elongation GreA/GreB family factor